MSEFQGRKAVIAIGGNAISPPHEEDTIANQFRNSRLSLKGVVDLIEQGWRIALTHGNGPQVGNALLRVEKALGEAPELPLGVIVADTQGGLGYMFEQTLQNGLLLRGIERSVVTLVTQVLVDKNDPNLLDPSKYVGQYYTKEEAEIRARQYNWVIKPADRGKWRRVVGSPIPLEIINKKVIKKLVDEGIIVITVGGGGIPVYRETNGCLEGVDAVIDKDRASAVLARDIGAQDFFILTGVDYVYLDYEKPTQRKIEKITFKELDQLWSSGIFPKGSMGPKVGAALDFLEWGGERVIITSHHSLTDAIQGKIGTLITH
ncbi:MAG: carbamate kinase [bacterium]|nr:carbamate kinase [bacterium]